MTVWNKTALSLMLADYFDLGLLIYLLIILTSNWWSLTIHWSLTGGHSSRHWSVIGGHSLYTGWSLSVHWPVIGGHSLCTGQWLVVTHHDTGQWLVVTHYTLVSDWWPLSTLVSDWWSLITTLVSDWWPLTIHWSLIGGHSSRHWSVIGGHSLDSLVLACTASLHGPWPAFVWARTWTQQQLSITTHSHCQSHTKTHTTIH